MREKNASLNVTKIRLDVMLVLLNVTIELSNVRKSQKKKEPHNEKSTITCDVNIIQCDDETIKCYILIIWYSMLSISWYHNPQKKKKKMKGYHRITPGIKWKYSLL